MAKHVEKRKAVGEKRTREESSLPVLNLNAAGIDVGSEEHWVAVPKDRDDEPVKRFGCFTADLHAMAQWLKKCGITTVAMESTGVYWIPPHQILEQYGFEVKLVNASHVKNAPGRKSDVPLEEEHQLTRATALGLRKLFADSYNIVSNSTELHYHVVYRKGDADQDRQAWAGEIERVSGIS